MFKAIIFDFGGVFLTDDDVQEFWINNAAKFNIDAGEANGITLPIWNEARVGRIDSNLFWEKAGAAVRMDPRAFKKYFVEYTGFREELFEYVKNNLKGKYKLAILSNQIESWLEPILEEKKFREIFDVIVTSYGSGYAKPDIRIYEKVLNELSARPEECIFIEDKPRNIRPAQDLGIRTIKFESFEQFKRELEDILKN